MDQGTGDSTQGQSTPVTDTMDQGTGDSTQGQSIFVTEDAIKLELPWSMKEEPQDQPSAVYSTVQPMSDNTSGSLDLRNSCQRCSAVFILPASLHIHMETVHADAVCSKLPVESRLHDNTREDPNETQNDHGGLSTTAMEDSTSASDNVRIKLEPPWSMKEEPQDQPSAVDSTVQPMSDNTSGSLLSLNTSHVCQRCSATFALFSSLELHMVTFHGETLHDWFPMHSAYDSSGVGYHHDSGTEAVGNCSKNSVKERKETEEDTDVDRTDQEKKSKNHACDVCSQAFTTAGALTRHKLVHTGHKPFVCDVCNRAFNRAGNLKTHKLVHTGHKPFVCDVCNRAFNRASTLKTHKSVHTGHKPHVCDVCSKAFTVAGELNKHKLINHTGHKAFVCDICSKAYPRISYLKIHKLTHTDHKPFVCDVCNKGFIQTSDLKKHKLIHTGEKPFVCDTCNKAFTGSSELKKHVRIHTGEKPYACDDCGAAFSESGTLTRHKKIHTGEKPYACTDCSKAFISPWDLKLHRLTHTGEKPHTCDVCGKAFTKESNLRKHKKETH